MKAWIGLIVTVGAMLMTLGYNWRRVDELSAATANQTSLLERLPGMLATTYVRQDVNSAQFSDIQRQLDEIKVLVTPRRPASSSDTPDRRYDR